MLLPLPATPLARIFHTDRDEETAKNHGVRQTNIVTPGCMCTYCSSHNVSLRQHPSAFPVFEVDECEISGLSLQKSSNPIPMHVGTQKDYKIRDPERTVYAPEYVCFLEQKDAHVCYLLDSIYFELSLIGF